MSLTASSSLSPSLPPSLSLSLSLLPVQVRGWLKARGEETLSSRNDIGEDLDSTQLIQEQHNKFEAKAKVRQRTVFVYAYFLKTPTYFLLFPVSCNYIRT